MMAGRMPGPLACCQEVELMDGRLASQAQTLEPSADRAVLLIS